MVSSFFPSCIRPAAGLTLAALIVTALPPVSQAQTAVARSEGPEATTPATIRPEEPYTLGPGDRLKIEVFKVPTLSQDIVVDVDGTLTLNQVGKVSVMGLTLDEATKAISKRYSALLRYPVVTVTVNIPRQVKVALAGEVNRPGSYVISVTEFSGNQPLTSQLPTLTRALSTAGGVTQAADLRRVQLRRQRRNGVEVINLNLWDFLKSGTVQKDITLRGGDSIYVPTAQKVDLAESTELAAANFAADKTRPLNIAVVGEVYRPGPYTVTGTTRSGDAGVPGGVVGGSLGPESVPTITRALQVAGGIKPNADVRKIQVRRTTKAGEDQIIEVNLWRLLKEGDVRQDLILQDRDTIVVPVATDINPGEATQVAAASFSPDSIRVNVVGEVNRSGIVQVPPNTPLNKAILAAGGFNNRARRGKVELVRLNPNGTVTRREVPVDFAMGLDEQKNPALQNEDVVIVNRSTISKVSDGLGTVLGPVGNFFGFFNVLRLFTGGD